MEKSRILFAVVILCLILFSSSCKEKGPEFTTEGQLKLILYTNPSTDCFDCILKAIQVLDKSLEADREISIFINKDGKPEEIANFKNLIKEKFLQRDFKYFEIKSMRFPHPSIFLARDRSIYMYFYITYDTYLLKENIGVCKRFLTNFDEIL